jgi:hypothetical protein
VGFTNQCDNRGAFSQRIRKKIGGEEIAEKRTLRAGCDLGLQLRSFAAWTGSQLLRAISASYCQRTNSSKSPVAS